MPTPTITATAIIEIITPSDAVHSLSMRLATAALAFAACAWTAAQGIGFIRYQAASDRWVSQPENIDVLMPWIDEPGLATAAIEAVLRAPVGDAGPDALKSREQMLVRLLTIKPAASRAWLSLATVRNALALPSDKVDAAFTMSGLTGPSEGAVMLERSLLGILVWERSSPNVRARTMTDLCGLPAFDPSKIRLMLSIKTEAVRAGIRAAMEANACRATVIKLVGL